MSRWRPSPEEERWLEVASLLGSAVPGSALNGRTGGWRSTGPLARVALFVLGLVAALLLLGVLGFSDETTLLIAGLVATLAAEWLTVQKRLHASGIEEGLSLAGSLLIGLWITAVTGSEPHGGWHPVDTLVLIAAAGAAGLRRLNPFVTTCAMIAFVSWVGSSANARTLDRMIGDGITAFTVGCTLAALALALGARHYRRPSHDHMLDWLVATLPVAAYSQNAAWIYGAVSGTSGSASTSRLAIPLVLIALGTTMLVTGLRRKRHAPLLGFLGCVACLAVELRLAANLSLETWLVVCGLVALIAGAGLDRYLRRPRNGLTSSKLTDRDGPLDLLQTAGAAGLAPRSVPETPPPEAGYTPGGGRFGGGGASGGY